MDLRIILAVLITIATLISGNMIIGLIATVYLFDTAIHCYKKI